MNQEIENHGEISKEIHRGISKKLSGEITEAIFQGVFVGILGEISEKKNLEEFIKNTLEKTPTESVRDIQNQELVEY